MHDDVNKKYGRSTHALAVIHSEKKNLYFIYNNHTAIIILVMIPFNSHFLPFSCSVIVRIEGGRRREKKVAYNMRLTIQ